MPATTTRPDSGHIVLHGVSWQVYDQLVNALSEQHVHMTYDRGELEIMSPSPLHEKLKSFIGDLVKLLADELEIDIVPLGSMTCRREDIERGLEPDECFYIKNEKLVWNKNELDFRRDPPPDLAIEIDITSSSLDRHSVYAALGVPELWRYDGESLRVYHLVDGEYKLRQHSLSFPKLPMNEFAHFLEKREVTRRRKLFEEFRKWIATIRKKK